MAGHRRVQEYGVKGLAGCVQQRVARSTGTLVGVYHSAQSGIEDDPALPWVTVCEVHSSCVCHTTLTLARSHAVEPEGWCESCLEVAERRRTGLR